VATSLKERIALALKTARETSGLSVFEVSRLSGVQPASIYAYEAGTTEPKAGALLALCAVYGVDPQSLLP
jgi:transcriptional regulator with XRE-family HTH domain